MGTAQHTTIAAHIHFIELAFGSGWLISDNSLTFQNRFKEDEPALSSCNDAEKAAYSFTTQGTKCRTRCCIFLQQLQPDCSGCGEYWRERLMKQPQQKNSR